MAKTISNIPDRDAIRKNFEGLYPSSLDALCEGIDNSFDYRPPMTPQKPGSIELTFERKGGETHRVILADDGSGLSLDEMCNGLMIKRQQQANGSCGAYGTGFKSMWDYLATNPGIISRKNGKLCWCFYNEPGEGWELDVHEEGDEGTRAVRKLWNLYAVDSHEDGTIHIMNGLKKSFDVKKLKKVLAWKYNTKIKESNVNIYVGEK